MFQEFLDAEVFSKDRFATQLHSSILTSKLLHHYSLAGVKVYLPCTQTLPCVTSPILVELHGGSVWPVKTTRWISEV